MVEEYGGIVLFAGLLVQSGIGAFLAAEQALQELSLTRSWGKTTVTLEPVPYGGPDGIRALMEELISRYGWVAIKEGDVCPAADRECLGEIAGSAEILFAPNHADFIAMRRRVSLDDVRRGVGGAIVGNHNLSLGRSKLEPARPLDWHKLRHRSPRLGDNDLFAHGDPLQQSGEMGFSLVDIDFHAFIIA